MKSKTSYKPAPKSKNPAKAQAAVPAVTAEKLQPSAVIPGEVFLGKGDIVAFEGRQTTEVIVANTGDRPIQVGSHCHFFEVNRALQFDREQAYGFRLEVPAGTAVRFEPGEEKRVKLVAIAGNRAVYGINGLVSGRLVDPQTHFGALAKAAELGFIIKTKK